MCVHRGRTIYRARTSHFRCVDRGRPIGDANVVHWPHSAKLSLGVLRRHLRTNYYATVHDGLCCCSAWPVKFQAGQVRLELLVPDGLSAVP